MSVRSADDLLRDAQQVSPVLSERLVAWQRQEGRHHLPWQNVRDPYRVWLSEIMLQQTQVSTVLGYFDRFLTRFPDVAALAAAPQDEVMALWAGLGYYSRARNLHRCAQAVVAEHGGVFPRTAALLQTLPGIGPSTASAIASFCFNERISIMDGNVKRVLGRVLAWGEDLSVKVHERALWAAAQQVLPERAEDMPAYTQGLMDLGATLCTPRKPACLTCPWSDLCLGRRDGDPERFPVKGRKLVRGERESWLPWLEWQAQVWLQQMPETGVWGGLWTLPLLESEAELQSLLGETLSGRAEAQPRSKHVLTHLDWWLNPRRLVLNDALEASVLAEALKARVPSGRWVPLSELPNWGLPAPVKRWLVG